MRKLEENSFSNKSFCEIETFFKGRIGDTEFDDQEVFNTTITVLDTFACKGMKLFPSSLVEWIAFLMESNSFELTGSSLKEIEEALCESIFAEEDVRNLLLGNSFNEKVQLNEAYHKINFTGCF